jgi:alpha-tubulin suppressor-like RCC1 family protein
MPLYEFSVIAIAAGHSGLWVLTITVLVLGTGHNSNDQLGISDSKVSQYTILNFLSGTYIVHIVAFGDSSGAIDEFGKVHIWGSFSNQILQFLNQIQKKSF